MMEDKDTLAFTEVVELHCREVAGKEGGGGVVEEVHWPAVEAVVLGLLQQAHDPHPLVCRAGKLQQHPDRHKLVPQSALEAHTSPGELRAQDPVNGLQAWHPARAAVGEQQNPPLQAPLAQELLVVQTPIVAPMPLPPLPPLPPPADDAKEVGVEDNDLIAVGDSEADTELHEEADEEKEGVGLEDWVEV